MLSWGRGGPGAKAERVRAAAAAAALATTSPFPRTTSPAFQDGSDEETHSEAASLLPGTNAVARRRNAIKVKRKSRVAFRLSRWV